MGALTKTDINPVSVFRVFDLLSIHIKPYESKLSTALSECKAVARCATRKTETAINRIKTIGVCKTVDIIRKAETVINKIETVGVNCAPTTVINKNIGDVYS